MKDKLYAGLGATEPIIRASWVKRFHMLPMMTEQNIAEHQWNVAMLFLQIWPMIQEQACGASITHPAILQAVGMKWALVHDLPESMTGDFPTHVKYLEPEMKVIVDRVEQAVMPDWWNAISDEIHKPEYAVIRQAIKACDIADTLRMCRYVKNPAGGDFVRYAMLERLAKIVEGLPLSVTNLLTEYHYNG